MLNLVQLQERLKDVPMQALMQYANGANPQVPPFLALGELNRRKKMQESAAVEQAKEMEGAPTVKQQIEQAAGLMALQGNRQQQAARQQAGIQAAMPMAAPNTTTSEPAQLAGGGFIDDIVVPRDFQTGGGVMNPEDLKRRMLREAMQGDVADIPKELMSAFGRSALRRRPGIAGVPLPLNMFKRSDYAGGGIVAFAGPEGSLVEDPIGVAPYETDDMETRRKREELRRKYAGIASPLGMLKPVKPGQEREYQQAREEIQNLLNVLGRYNKKDLGAIETALADQMSKFGSEPARATAASKNLPQASYSNEGRAYERGRPGALDPTTQGPITARKIDTSGIEQLLAPSSESKVRTPDTPKTTPEIDFLRKLYNKPDLDIAEELKRRGLDVRPQSRAGIEELERQREQIKGEDTVVNRFLSLTPGRRFGTGETGKGIVAFEKEQANKLRQIGFDLAKAKDLETQAEFAHKMGNFKLERELMDKAEDNKRDAAKSAGQMGVSLEQVEAQRANTAAQIDATKEATRSRLTSQLNSQRLSALNQAFRPIDEQIQKIQNLAALGSPLTPQQKAQLDALRREKALIEDKINRDYDQRIAALGGDGGYRVVNVRPGP